MVRVGRRRELFRCDMLQKKIPQPDGGGGHAWEDMSCAAVDDYEDLLRMQVSQEDFSVDSRIWLLSPGLEHVARQEGAAPYCREALIRDVWEADSANVDYDFKVSADVLKELPTA